MKRIALLVALASTTLFAAGNNVPVPASDTTHASSLEPGQDGKKPARAKKKIDPAFVDIQDVSGLPRVLLIGDSISIGYTLPVRARLTGRANVHRVPANCGDTGRGLQNLDSWLGTGRWDVIHFNFGLHDLKYLNQQGKYVPPAQGRQVAPPAAYEENLRQLVKQLKKSGARLVFATTTQVPDGTLGRVQNDEIRYNEAAARVMKETGVVIDDLHAVVAPNLAEWQNPKNVHFTPTGYEQLADAVVASIAPLLPLPAKENAAAARQAQDAAPTATSPAVPALVPDPDAAEVLCVGDSITQKKYPSVLQQLLGKRFRVVDAGHSGTTAMRLGDRPYRYETMKVKPRYVIVMLGTNDTKKVNWAHAKTFQQDMCGIVRFFQATSPTVKVFVALPPPIYRTREDWPQENMEEIVTILPKVAAATGVTLIDVHGATSGKSHLFRDGVHPAAEGNAIIAKVMFEAIQKAR